MVAKITYAEKNPLVLASKFHEGLKDYKHLNSGIGCPEYLW